MTEQINVAAQGFSGNLVSDAMLAESTYALLGKLAKAEAFHGDLLLPENPAPFVASLERMIVIRLAEERIGESVATGRIKCPCHLAIGQEAPAVGVAMNLRDSDRAFGAHRSHAHFLAVTNDLHGLFAEIMGKDTGVSRGMGGSMHLIARAHGFHGSVPIVGATIPIAVGAALAAKMDGKGDIAVSYFGDGATEEGGFHESMNLAAVLKLPVLFVCENNLFASHMHIDLRQPADSECRYALAHGVPFARVDGNDVPEITRVVADAVARMREKGGPFFLECITYRWRGHVGHREDEDVGVKRKDDLTMWKKRDPIARLARALEAAGAIQQGDVDAMYANARERIADAWAQAECDPHPPSGAHIARTWSPARTR